MNIGHFYKDSFVKLVSFDRAVLWSTKELSIPVYVLNKIVKDNIPMMRFIDQRRNEKWDFVTKEVLEKGHEKMFRDELQFYFPISLATIHIIPKEGGE